MRSMSTDSNVTVAVVEVMAVEKGEGKEMPSPVVQNVHCPQSPFGTASSSPKYEARAYAIQSSPVASSITC